MRIELQLAGTTNCTGPDRTHPLDQTTSRDPGKEPVAFKDGQDGVRVLNCRWLRLREDGTAACDIFRADLPYAIRRTITAINEGGVKGQKAFNQLTQELNGFDGLVRRAEADFDCRLARRDI